MIDAAILGPADAWLLGRLVIGESVDADFATLPELIRGPASHLAGLAPDRRGDAWAAIRAALGRAGDDLTVALAAVDPRGPRPEPGATAAPPIRCATVADLARVEAGSRFAWKGWIVGGHLTLLSSEVKVGKTRVGMSLARRLWLGEPWPDGQPATFPERTPTLWIPGDRHHCELADLAAEFGLPPEAVLFNADPESPYGGWDLDDPENVEGLRRRVEAYRPGLVFIDTLWKCTRQNLCSAREVNLVVDPLITIAQEADAAIVAMMHLSIAGETLGRRLEGAARAVIKMDRPDPEGHPDRRKLWVDRSNFKAGPALGVTVKDGPCEFDHAPPRAGRPEAARGRPPVARAKAEDFLTAQLAAGDRKLVDLIDGWEAGGNNKTAIFDAKRAMEEDGRLVVDDSQRPKVVHLVRASGADAF